MTGSEPKQHPLVVLARNSIITYLREGSLPEVNTADIDELGLPARAASFVSLKKGGNLRGCIGTVLPARSSLAEEVMENAVSAATRDPRFEPVTEDELDDISVSVDVLTEPEEVADISSLDPSLYGLIVRSQGRTGVLLPDLPGIDTSSQQLSIAMQKAGIAAEDDLTIFRFEVVRYT